MVRGLAKATICGNVTRDPELRTTSNGNQVCSFGIAVNRVRKDASGNNVDEVSFFDIVAWGRQGETIAQYVKKGTGLLVSGRMTQSTWDDKNGGGKRSRVEVVLEDFCFLGSAAEAGNEGNYNAAGGAGKKANASKGDATEPEVVPDDIPEEGEVDVSDVPF